MSVGDGGCNFAMFSILCGMVFITPKTHPRHEYLELSSGVALCIGDFRLLLANISRRFVCHFHSYEIRC